MGPTAEWLRRALGLDNERIRTTKAALAAAAERWGKSAAVKVKPNGEKCVGVLILGFFEVRGSGATWDDAFAEADRGGLSWEAIPRPQLRRGRLAHLEQLDRQRPRPRLEFVPPPLSRQPAAPVAALSLAAVGIALIASLVVGIVRACS